MLLSYVPCSYIHRNWRHTRQHDHQQKGNIRRTRNQKFAQQGHHGITWPHAHRRKVATQLVVCVMEVAHLDSTTARATTRAAACAGDEHSDARSAPPCCTFVLRAPAFYMAPPCRAYTSINYKSLKIKKNVQRNLSPTIVWCSLSDDSR